MRRLFLLIRLNLCCLLLASLGSKAQVGSPIPKINFIGSVTSVFPIYDQLKIRDDQALIIKFFEYKIFNNTLEDKYIVFKNNGRIKSYTLKKSTGQENVIIEKKSVRKKDREIYWHYLDSLVSTNSIYLDSEELLKSPYSDQQDSISGYVHFAPTGRTCVLFFQGNKYLNHCVEGPIPVRENPVGIQEKLNFLDLYLGLVFLHHSPRQLIVE